MYVSLIYTYDYLVYLLVAGGVILRPFCQILNYKYVYSEKAGITTLYILSNLPHRRSYSVYRRPSSLRKNPDFFREGGVCTQANVLRHLDCKGP